jgi:hypothetical protein
MLIFSYFFQKINNNNFCHEKQQFIFIKCFNFFQRDFNFCIISFNFWQVMKIISRQIDYYDCMMKKGIDPSIVFVRDPSIKITKSLGFKNNIPFDSIHLGTTKYIYNYYLGFCGNIYPMFMDILLTSEYMKSASYHHISQTIDNAKKFYKKEDVIDYYDKISSYSLNKINIFFNVDKNLFASYFTHPIFLSGLRWEKKKRETNKVLFIYYNINLKSLSFNKIFNAQEAFQELQMYISNIAIPEKKPLVISDEEMAESKGFNKFSFRKDKTKKK